MAEKKDEFLNQGDLYEHESKPQGGKVDQPGEEGIPGSLFPSPSFKKGWKKEEKGAKEEGQDENHRDQESPFKENLPLPSSHTIDLPPIFPAEE
jgi:hypothetical protein